MPAEFDYDLFVIGGGSGGVRAARVSAAHGARVGLAEEYRVGGTCVIRGCVPKKLLVYGAHFAEDLADARRFGWDVPKCDFNWPTLRDNVLAEVDRIETVYGGILENNKVDLHHQRATVTGPNQVTLADGTAFTVGTILVATGSWPFVPDIPGAEHGITSNEVFHLDEIPKRAVIAGGGYIANEFAGILHEFGCKVTIVNRGEQILRGYDEQIRDRLLQISIMKGINFVFNAPFERIEKNEDGTLAVHLKNQETIETDMLLWAVGRIPTPSIWAGGGRREARQERRGAGRRGQPVQRPQHLRDRRRHRPRPAHPRRHPRGPGLRRHRVRQQALSRGLSEHPVGRVQPPADRRCRHDGG
jgi:glutathione reductase (NADPH)